MILYTTMRIVIDDNKSIEAVKLLEEFIKIARKDIRPYLKEEWGCERIQTNLLKSELNEFFGAHNFKIGKTATHKHNIGNNNRYPVWYLTKDEMQECCKLNLNRGLYGEAYLYLTDYDGQKLSKTYELHWSGIEEK